MRPIFFKSKEEAIQKAKEIDGSVVFSAPPGSDLNKTPKRSWGYWVEKPHAFIRTGEELIYGKGFNL